jgi:tape measure domain-containing protein
MELEQVVVRLVADTSQYLRQLDYAGSRLVGFAAGAVAAVAHHGVVMAAEFEKTSIAFATMTKDAAVAKQLVEDITDMAIRTPFKSNELMENAKQLKAFGFETKNIVNIMDVLGNVSSGTNTPLARIVLAFGQVRVAGKLMGTELRQFVDAGIPIIEELAKVMGEPEARIRSLVEQGHVGFDLVAKAFDSMTAKGGLFSGLMARINRDTVAGQWQSLTENLEVTSRNFVLAAFNGLRLRAVLESISQVITPTSKGPQESVTSAFRNIRLVLDAILMTGGKVWSWISSIGRAVGEWADRNRALVIGVAALLGYFLAIRAAAYGFLQIVAVFRMMLGAMQALLSMTILLKVAMVALSAVTSIMAVVEWIAILGPALIVIIPLLIAIGVLISSLNFDRFGESFKRAFGDLKSVATDAFGGIKDAINAGDIDLAFEILLGALEIGFRRLFLSLKVEWGVLERMMNDGIKNMIREAGRAGGILNPLGSTIFDKVTPELLEKQKKDQDALRNQLEAGIKDDPTLWSLMKEQNKRLGAAKTGSALADRSKWVSEHAEEISGIRSEMMLPIDKEMHRMDTTMRDILRYTGKMTGKEGEMGIIVGDAGKLLFQKQMEFAEKYRNTPWGDAVGPDGKMTHGNLILPDPRDKKFTADMINRQIGTQYGVGGEARDAANKLEKEIQKGRFPIDHFNKMVRNYTEAYEGPAFAKQLGAVVGMGGATNLRGTGPDGKLLLQGIMDKKSFDIGMVENYMDLRKSLASMEGGKLAPSLGYGSTAAQDAINANRDQGKSVQEDILATLTEAKEVAKQQRDYEAKIAEALDNIMRSGQFDQFRDAPPGFNGKGK